MSPQFPSSSTSGKIGPSWLLWPCWTIESTAVVCNTYGLRTESVRWQYETLSSAGCCATTGGPVVVVCSGNALVDVDELDGGVVLVDEEAGAVGVVAGCAIVGAPPIPRTSNVAIAPLTTDVRRMSAS